MRRVFNKLNEKKGFTLAELLIVVAIIAVLVAVAIPIFTTQLEKSREATDAANIRAIYAELSADILLEDTTATGPSVAASYSITKSGTVVTGTATYVMKQQTNGTANDEDIEIGGVTVDHDDFKTGTCTITVKSDGSAPTFAW
ncbi:MAG: prepilin-type N-terminal cleavage/methylation domain-containing protein [Lachnospiraceae bacterium]|nr:prepilin-type N-terminal cleavage/methylation domain-containing protein [Lachnospiraceae bacterium]